MYIDIYYQTTVAFSSIKYKSIKCIMNTSKETKKHRDEKELQLSDPAACYL